MFEDLTIGMSKSQVRRKMQRPVKRQLTTLLENGETMFITDTITLADALKLKVTAPYIWARRTAPILWGTQVV